MNKLEWLRQQIIRDNYHYDPLNVEFHTEAIKQATTREYGTLFYAIVPSVTGVANDTEATYDNLKDYPESLFWHRDNSIYHVDYSPFLIGAKVCWKYCRNLGLFKETTNRWFHGFIWSEETAVGVKLGDFLVVKNIPDDFPDRCQAEYDKYDIPSIWNERKNYKAFSDEHNDLTSAYDISVNAIKEILTDYLVDTEHKGQRQHEWVKQRTGRFPIR